DYAEEQANELEVLRSIYPDELEVSVHLEVLYTPTYPDELPQLRAEECLGMVMVFNLAALIKEDLEQLVVERRERLEQEATERLRKEAEEEQKKFAGTKVTPEVFLAWKVKFDAERAQEMAEKKKRDERRQMFEGDSTLALSDAKYIEEGEVTVDSTLFEDEEDLDLTDDEDEED
ncbi:hypothetical protein THASP1DRAFT_2719, partial [Thamnocephalis sphaerospora]